MESLELENLILTYPKCEDPLFQAKISVIEEFYELKSEEMEGIPMKGEFFKHQKIIQRLMFILDEILLIHKPGTGKTCAFAAFAELIKKIYLKHSEIAKTSEIRVVNPDEFYPYRHAMVILSNGVVEDFKYQMACKCTNIEYLKSENVKSASSDSIRRKRINSEIAEFYTIDTRGSFANKLAVLTDAQIEATYSGNIVMVDEVHNIKNDDENGKTEVYKQLNRFLHLIKRRKIFLLSATPMINDSSEISDIMNLILPMNMQIPPDINYNEDLTPLKKYFNGRVSYVRDLKIGLNKISHGEPFLSDGKEYGNLLFCDVDINTPQGQMIAREGIRTNEANEAFSLKPRNVCNFVFPDGSFGIEGFGKYISEIEGNYFITNQAFAEELKNFENLRKYSVKFYNFIKMAVQNEGKRYAFCEFVEGSGINLLTALLNFYGFEKFRDKDKLFDDESDDSKDLKLIPYCDSIERVKGRKFLLDKKLRFCVLTSDVTKSPAIFTKLLKAVNSYENRHGEYIKILIGSKASSEGINLNSFTNFDYLTPWWNQSRLIQAENRIFRVTGFTYLFDEKRKLAISRGENPNDVMIDINVYLYCTRLTRGPDIIDTIETHMYKIAYDKFRKTSRVMKFMVESAVDCILHKKRNLRSTDDDYSEDCFFEECGYNCVNENEFENIGNITDYNIYNLTNFITDVSEKIKEFLKKEFSISFEEIYKRLPKISKNMINISIQDMITNRERIMNMFGVECFVESNGDKVFLSENDKINELSVLDTYYIENLHIDLDEDSKKRSETAISNFIKEYENQSSENIIKALVTDKKPEFKIGLAEYIIYKYYVEKIIDNNFINTLFRYWYNHIFMFNKPEREFALQSELLGAKTRRGKRSKEDKIDDEYPGEILEDSRTQQVVSHTLSVKYKGLVDTRYGDMPSYFSVKGDLRILLIPKIEKKNLEFEEIRRLWVTPNDPIETPVYRAAIITKIYARINEFISKAKLFYDRIDKRLLVHKDMGYIGIYNNETDIFRIMDVDFTDSNLKRTTLESSEKIDKRKVHTGKKCSQAVGKGKSSPYSSDILEIFKVSDSFRIEDKCKKIFEIMNSLGLLYFI